MSSPRNLTPRPTGPALVKRARALEEAVPDAVARDALDAILS